MSVVYEELGVRPLINAAGTQTRYGGVPLPEEVVRAMAEAATACVRMEDLQEAAGRVITEATGAEAGYVREGRLDLSVEWLRQFCRFRTFARVGCCARSVR